MQNLIFRFLQNKTRISVWLYDNKEMRVEGVIIVSPWLVCNVLCAVERRVGGSGGRRIS